MATRTVIDTSLADGGIAVTFSDGSTVLFNVDFLLQHRGEGALRISAEDSDYFEKSGAVPF
jgi:hypothetical protein